MKGGATILSLCDFTGNFVKPWVEAGYAAVLVDPQHAIDHERDGMTCLARTVEEAMPDIARLVHGGDLAFVAAFPPCTDLAVSGAKHFQRKAKESKAMFQARAAIVAEQCRTIGALSGVPYMVENPVSVLSSLWGKPDHLFDPLDFTGYEPGDNYHKRTCLWTGGGFVMPELCPDETLGPADDRIHKAPPGPDRANFRSATPMGFARAVFEANQPTPGGRAAPKPYPDPLRKWDERFGFAPVPQTEGEKA
jgi:hypothetical protein